MSTTVKADTAIFEYTVKVYHAAFDRLEGVANLLFSMTFEPIPVSTMENSISRGGNSMGLKPENGPVVVVLFYTSWDSASDDELVYNVNRDALASIEKEAQSNDVSSSYRYLNYAFPHQDPFGSYGPEAKAELLRVSAKYDPDGFFQSAGAGPFKL